jgi:hypothetical protein
LNSLFKFYAEIYRPITTWFFPGLIATCPWFLIFREMPWIRGFVGRNPSVSYAIAFVFCLAAGHLLENLGAIYETKVLDPRPVHNNKAVISSEIKENEWWDYLATTFEIDPIGQRYLRSKFLGMKLELSLAMALLVGTLNLGIYFMVRPDILLQFLVVGSRLHTILIVFSFIVPCLIWYLLWEAGNSSDVLAKIRHILVDKKKLKQFSNAKREKKPNFEKAA